MEVNPPRSLSLGEVGEFRLPFFVRSRDFHQGLHRASDRALRDVRCEAEAIRPLKSLGGVQIICAGLVGTLPDRLSITVLLSENHW
jgi:hypothetical protein